jgi:DNA-binding CsgD family transcriptional regulator
VTASPAQLKAARLLLGYKTQAALAARLGISIDKVNAGERQDRRGRGQLADRLQAFFEANGVEFIDNGVGVRLKK